MTSRRCRPYTTGSSGADDDSGMRLISGVVVFGADLEPVENATIHVHLEAVRYADAPGVTIAEERIEHASLGMTTGRTVEFQLRCDLPETEDCRVRVHVDVDGNGVVSRGDYVSTAVHRIPERARAATAPPLRIPVHRVI